MTNQLLSIKAETIAPKKISNGTVTTVPLPMTIGRQSIIGYMARRIEIMKRDKKNKAQTQSETIRFDTLWKSTGTETTDRKQLAANRKFCCEVLDYWKATGYIKDYEIQKNGRAMTGVKISL